MNPHGHTYSIADREALGEFIHKLSAWDLHQERRERLLRALGDAIEQLGGPSDERRKAFFHGLLTGYAVALKLW